MKNAEGKENSPVFDERPWGTFTTLDEGTDFKVKRIEVYPSKRLSYQKHAHRSEHWFVVRGNAKVTLNGEEFLLKNGDNIDIPVGTAHRVENPDAEQLLVFIETQTGDYFGEDDIERLEDDFGRLNNER
jgi:mannose-6-phosphate isomerase-like protein (cupin superfamily)